MSPKTKTTAGMSDNPPNVSAASRVATRWSWLPLVFGVLVPVGGFAWLAATRSPAPALSARIPRFAAIGSVEAITIVMVVAVLVLKRERRMIDAGFLTASVVGAVVGNLVVKAALAGAAAHAWDRTIGFALGFPSGMAMATFALAAALAALARKTGWRWELTCLGGIYVAVIAFALVRSGVSLRAEVLAGWELSLAWVVTLNLIRQYLRGRASRPPATLLAG